ETTFAVWKLGAIPAPISYRLPRGEANTILDLLKPALVVGGAAGWGLEKSVPADFMPEGVSDAPFEGPVSRYWVTVTSGGSTGRPKAIVSHRPSVVDTDKPESLMEPGVSLLNPGPLYHSGPFAFSHCALFVGGTVTGMTKFDAEEALRLIEANKVSWINF